MRIIKLTTVGLLALMAPACGSPDVRAEGFLVQSLGNELRTRGTIVNNSDGVIFDIRLKCVFKNVGGEITRTIWLAPMTVQAGKSMLMPWSVPVTDSAKLSLASQTTSVNCEVHYKD